MSIPLNIDPERIADILRETAEAEILPRFRTLESHEISEKNPGDLVTVADQASEALLTARLKDIIPGALIIGEEAHEIDPAALAELDASPWTWILDPLDGTHNFAHGTPRFAVIVALAHYGETVMGWIYDPVNDRMAVVEKDAGALLAGRKLVLAPTRPLVDMTGSVNARFVERLRARARRQDGTEVPTDFQRYRCVGLEYQDLARGHLDFARYGGKLMPWDHAAGVLLYREAGGHAAMSGDGRTYSPAGPRPGDALLLAPDTNAWASLDTLMVPDTA